MQSLEITIVGAGIAGLAAAIALRRNGHSVRICERFAQSLPIGSGLMMQPTGLAALERLGLREAIEARGARIDGLFGDTTSGRTVFNLKYSSLGAEHYAVGIHRAALHGVLRRAFEKSGATLETETDIQDFDIGAEGRVFLQTASGERFDGGDLVIDASGARSRLALAVSGRKPRPFQYGAVWATVADIGFRPRDLSQRYQRARRMMGYLPVGAIEPGGAPLAAFFWSLPQGEVDRWSADFEAWREIAREYWPELSDVIGGFSGPQDFSFASYGHATMRRPYRGRLVFAGDAAHSTSPQLGQGANQGIIDGVVLADAVQAGTDIDDALRKYAAARRAHVRFYQVASAVMTPLFQSDQRILPALRDIAFDRMRLVPYLHREMLRTLCGMKTGLFAWRSPNDIVRL